MSASNMEAAMKVVDVMHKGINALEPQTPIAAVAMTMQEKDVGALPITENGALIGIVTDRDIAIRGLAQGGDTSKLTARDVMTTGVAFCMERDTVKDAAQVMESRKVRRLPVLDGGKKVIGMLSLGDISHAASRELTSDVMKAVSAHHA
jgi:CBS domain-containing protein